MAYADFSPARKSIFPPILKECNTSSPRTIKQVNYAGIEGLQFAITNKRQGISKTTLSSRKTSSKDDSSMNGIILKKEAKILKEPEDDDHEKILKDWDMALEKRKKEELERLQKRVGIQRTLIAKQDQLHEVLEFKARREREQRLRFRKDKCKEITAELRQYVAREKPDTPLIRREYVSNSPQDQGFSDVESDPAPSLNEEENEEEEDAETEVEMLRRIESYQMQRTSDRIGTLDRMWKEFKDRSMKELKPAMLHFTKIIQNVSPSVKECLDIYANPAPVDKYTGKPILLTQVLNEAENERSRGVALMLNEAMETIARETQMIAEGMLKQRAPNNNNIMFSPNRSHKWCGDLIQDKNPGDTSVKVDNRKTSLMKQKRVRERTSSSVKKLLPLFLTENGELVSGSIEELDSEMFFCCPSQKLRYPGEEEQSRESSSSIFLTDLPSHDEQVIPRSAVINYDNVVQFKSTEEPRRSLRNWQPLSANALLEHTTVTQQPIKTKSPQTRGYYPMWRPAKCYVEKNNHHIKNK